LVFREEDRCYNSRQRTGHGRNGKKESHLQKRMSPNRILRKGKFLGKIENTARGGKGKNFRRKTKGKNVSLKRKRASTTSRKRKGAESKKRKKKKEVVRSNRKAPQPVKFRSRKMKPRHAGKGRTSTKSNSGRKHKGV